MMSTTATSSAASVSKAVSTGNALRPVLTLCSDFGPGGTRGGATSRWEHSSDSRDLPLPISSYCYELPK